MSSQSSFASFASSGAFTGDPKITIPQNVKNINNALTLFVLTKALNGNKYEAELIQTSNIVPGTDFCHYPKYDNKGEDICWHDTGIFGGVIGRLRKTDGNDGKKGPDMQQKVLQAGWATKDTLFGAGWRCARSGKFGQTVADLGPDRKLTFDCLNQMPQCFAGTLKGCSDYVDGNCPIERCDS